MDKSLRPPLLTHVAVVLCLVACSGHEQQGVAAQPVSSDSPDTAPWEQPAADSARLEQLIEFAKGDLAQRLGIESDSITVAEARSVTWRSGAIGCPQPGMSYTQALVPGYLVRLQTRDAAFSYHSSSSGAPFHCPPERVEKPAAVGTSKQM